MNSNPPASGSLPLKTKAAKPHSIQLARHLGLFDACMIGIGAMIGAGIFVLTGIATGKAGPAAIFAFSLNGVVTLFTALSYAELSSAIPEAGGGYAFIKKIMPNYVAFLAGWMLWFAYVVACSLYARGFGSYAFEMLEQHVPGLAGLAEHLGRNLSVAILTAIVGLFFIGLNIIGTSASGKTENLVTVTKVLILVVFVGFGVNQVFSDPAMALSNFNPLFPQGVGGVLAAMGLTFIAFEGYDLIATMSEEIKDPSRTVPKAILLSLGITVVIYVFVVFVCLGAVAPDGMPTWRLLGEAGEVGILRAAQSFMPAFGVILVLVGGLFSTMSALNATVMASSRVAFSMGRDRMLPGGLGALHPKRRTPTVAIALSGLLFLGIAFFLPLDTIGTATSLLFLLSFGLTNAALILYRQRNKGAQPAFRTPFFPLVPILGILTCLALAAYQLIAQPIAWLLAVIWIAVGMVIFGIFFTKKARVSEVVATIENPELLALKKTKAYKILVPLANPERVEPLLQVASMISQASRGRILALSVVQVPEVTAYAEAGPFLENARSLLARAQEVALRRGVDCLTMVSIARDAAAEILRVAKENDCSLILLGYKRDEDPLENSIIHRVILHQPCDVAILKTDRTWEAVPSRILVPVRGGDAHRQLKARLLHSFHKAGPVEVELLNVIPPQTGAARKELARQVLQGVAAHLKLPEIEMTLEETADIAGTVAARANRCDLLVLGMRDEPWFRTFFFGTQAQQITSQVTCPTILVKTVAKGRKRMKRLLARSDRA